MADRRSFLDMRRKGQEHAINQARYSQIVTLNSDKFGSRRVSLASCQSSLSSNRSLNLNLVTSPNNITQKLLPKFARIANPSTSFETSISNPFDLKASTSKPGERLEPQTLGATSQSLQGYSMPRSKTDTGPTPFKEAEKLQSPGSLLKMSTMHDIRFSPHDSISESGEVVAKLGKRELSSYDIQCFRDGVALPRAVVDYYLKHLRRLNRKLTSSKEPQDRVFISNTNFSQRLFNRSGTLPHARVNVFKYE
jgi:hypothetical protein